jgi:hypothetical protein|tara:strand:- start:1627 stop:1938 length:312 start_codon:yes stop_codon:yes gene_type:complete
MQPIEVSMTPAIFRAHTGMLYAIAGSVWVELPEGTTRSDLPQYMVHKHRESARVADEKAWSVKGSKGNIYSVALSEGAYTCSCPGFGFRRNCRHIKEIKNEQH